MNSIFERDGPDALLKLLADNNLPAVLALPDVAFCLVLETLSRADPSAAAGQRFEDGMLFWMNALQNAIRSGALPAELRRDRKQPARELYAVSEMLSPWRPLGDVVAEHVETGEPPGTLTAYVTREHLRCWFESSNAHLPGFWFALDERQAHAERLAARRERERLSEIGARQSAASDFGADATRTDDEIVQAWLARDAELAADGTKSQRRRAAIIAAETGAKANTVRKKLREQLPGSGH